MNYIQIILENSVNVSQPSPDQEMDDDELKQRLHELEKELSLVQEENISLRSDLESAKQFMVERKASDAENDSDLAERRVYDLQRKLEDAQEELIAYEHQREDEKIKIEVM